MTETTHEHCGTCDWLAREAERTAEQLDRNAWLSKTQDRDGTIHWGRYEKETDR